MQAKAKLRGDHHSFSLLRLLRDELSLPACLFPTSPGGGIGVFGGAGGFSSPCAGEEFAIGFAHQQQDSRGSVLEERDSYSIFLQAHGMAVSCQGAGAMLSVQGNFRVHDGESCWP